MEKYKSLKFLLILVFFLLINGSFFVHEAMANNVACDATWPQKVVIDGVAHSCGSGRNYCNFDSATIGVGECCATYAPYQDCVSAGPVLVPLNYVKKTLSSGEIWYVGGGYQFKINSIDAKASPRQVWIEFSYNGTKLEDVVLTSPGNDTYVYRERGKTYDTFSVKLDSVFAGAVADMAQFINPKIMSIAINSVTTPTMVPLQNQYASSKKTLAVGETWKVTGRLNLYAQAIDAKADPRQISVVLLDNCKKIDDRVVAQGQYYTYGNSFKVYVDSIFAGAVSDMVQFRFAAVAVPYDTYLPPEASSNWSCGEWSSCQNGQQNRTCTDSNGCYSQNNKPAVAQSCCSENWSCGEWSSCQNGQQTKTCADLNNCGTTANKPNVVQNCFCTASWSCGEWSSCQNGQQIRTCSDINNCGDFLSEPDTKRNCQSQNQCRESWSCGEWSSCQSDEQARACTDLNKCGTQDSKPATSQKCVCAENWSCGEWSSCQNSQQTRICKDFNSCGTGKNKPALKQNCFIQSEAETLSPKSTTSNTSTSSSSHSSDVASRVEPSAGEAISLESAEAYAYVNDARVVVEEKPGGIFTITSGNTEITTSLEIVSSSSKPYVKASSGLQEIKISPQEIKARVSDKINTINKIEIKEQNQKTIFHVSGTKKGKLLFVFPVSIKTEVQLDLEKGEIILVKKPWWSFLVRF